VVSHETTHQLAATRACFRGTCEYRTGFTRDWRRNFENARRATWGRHWRGQRGAPNDLPSPERDREHSNIGFIVADQIFDYARSLGAQLHGYGQAWALTHFLMERHFDKFLAFYRRLGELPPDTFLNSDIINQLFR